VLEHHALERPGCTIHFWSAGPPDRPLVILTHGAWLDHAEWDALFPLLAHRYRVVVWDVRAHGRSRPTTIPFTIRAAANDLVAILDHLRVDKATLVGHSMGGNISQEVVFLYPERVDALVLLGCTCNTLPLSRLDRFWLRLGMPLLHLYPRDLLIAQSARAGALVPGVQVYLAAAFDKLFRAELVAILSATTDCLPEEPGYRIAHPLLLAHGAEDATGNIRRIAPLWAAREPHCRYEVIPDAGHTANLDNPTHFDALLLDFLHAQHK
jgi:3-oxoadipate enol-lactonase